MHFAIAASSAAIVVLLCSLFFILGANVAQPKGMEHWFERYKEIIAALISVGAALFAAFYAWRGIEQQIRMQTVFRESDKLERALPAIQRLAVFFLSISQNLQTRSTKTHFETVLRYEGIDPSKLRETIHQKFSDAPLALKDSVVALLVETQFRILIADRMREKKDSNEIERAHLGVFEWLKIVNGFKERLSDIAKSEMRRSEAMRLEIDRYLNAEERSER